MTLPDYASVTGSTPWTRLRRRLPRGMRRVNVMLGGWSTLVLLFLYLPIVVLVLWSFNESSYSTKWSGFSTKWYSAFWHRTVLDARDAIDPADAGWRHWSRATLDWAGAAAADDVRAALHFPQVWGQIPRFTEGIKNSLIVGIAATALSTLLGTTAAWLIFKYRYPFHRTLATLIAVPMIVPEIIMGVSLLSFFTVVSGLVGRVWMSITPAALGQFGLSYAALLAVIVAHVTFTFPYVMVTIQARLAGIDPALEEAAMDLGATPAKAFVKVIVPYLMPAIVSGMLMAFTLSLDDFIVTYFVKDAQTETLPIRIYGAVKGPPPMLHVVSTLMVAITVLTVLLSEGIKRLNR